MNNTLSAHRAAWLLVALAIALPQLALAETAVRLRTSVGDIFVNLTPDTAPNTVSNFLEYINNGDFVDSFFHDSQQLEGAPRTLTSGRFRWPDSGFSGITEVRTGPVVANEFNQSNTRGTIAMVRVAGITNSATNSWFVNVTDNGGDAPEGLDFVDGGATVFGSINAAGMDVIDAIAGLNVEDRGNDFESLPVLTQNAGSLRRDQVVLIESTSQFDTVTPPASAILPLSRVIPSTGVAGAFATLVNSSDTAAASCRLAPTTEVDADFAYRQTNPLDNVPFGDLNPVVDIGPNGLATFVFTFAPQSAFTATDIEFDFSCGNASESAAVTLGVNTFVLSSTTAPVGDVVALAGTLNNNGIIDISAASGAGAFVVATSNVGSGEQITVSANTGAASLPVELFVCPTVAVTGQCQQNPALSATENLLAGSAASYAVFAQLTQNDATIAFDPAVNRVFVEFRTADGALRGSTSVALRTVP